MALKTHSIVIEIFSLLLTNSYSGLDLTHVIVIWDTADIAHFGVSLTVLGVLSY